MRPASGMFRTLWSAVAPNGRLIGVTPNADNQFVRRRAEERPRLYAPLGTAAIIHHVQTLPGLADLGVIGFVWREDHSSLLYDLLPLTSTTLDVGIRTTLDYYASTWQEA